MLYDVLPPLIFLFSLGGIIFLMARVSMRVRRVDFQSSMSAAATAPVSNFTTPRRVMAAEDADMATLLRPSHKGVKVITSRMSGLLASVQTVGQGLRERSQQLPAKWRARREAKRTEKIETVDITETVVAASPVVTPSTPAKLTKPSRLVGRLRSVTGQLQERSQSQLQALKRVAQSRRQPAPQATEEVSEPTPVKVPMRSTMMRRTTSAVKTTEPAIASFRATRKPHQPTNLGSSALLEVRGLIEAAEYQPAEDLLLPHIVKHPKDTTAYLLLGEIALAREAWDEAQEIYEQVLRINPQTKDVYAGLGLAAYHAGNFTKALQMLQRALNEDSTNRQVLEAVLSLAQKMDNPALQHSVTEQLEELDRLALVPSRSRMAETTKVRV